MTIGYVLNKIKCKFLRKKGPETCEIINHYFKKKGVKIGYNCRLYSDIVTSESYLITIGDNVTISNDVQLITHDNSVIKIIDNATDVFGEIVIGNNCFIGARSIILPGVTIGNNCIIGAGSVVAKSIPDGSIVAGNPARIISTIDLYQVKIKDNCFNIAGLNTMAKKRILMTNKNKFVSK